MSRPFHILKHEHRMIEQALRALDGACLRLDGGLQIPAKDLCEIIDFINAFADRYHHRKEEQVLFPVLERCGITREGGPLGAIEREHEIERKLVGELRLAIAEYREGDAEARRRFVEAARAYIKMFVAHMETEDTLLFRLADEVLEEEDRDELIESFRAFHSQIGMRPLEEYEKRASELEDAWAF